MSQNESQAYGVAPHGVTSQSHHVECGAVQGCTAQLVKEQTPDTPMGRQITFLLTLPVPLGPRANAGVRE